MGVNSPSLLKLEIMTKDKLIKEYQDRIGNYDVNIWKYENIIHGVSTSKRALEAVNERKIAQSSKQLCFQITKDLECLEQISKTEKEIRRYFTWGKVIEVHEIGEYSIVEYNDEKRGVIGEEKEHENVIKFHPYINGIDTNHSYDSLDAAIVGAIANKLDGSNSQAGGYFMKMVK